MDLSKIIETQVAESKSARPDQKQGAKGAAEDDDDGELEIFHRTLDKPFERAQNPKKRAREESKATPGDSDSDIEKRQAASAKKRRINLSNAVNDAYNLAQTVSGSPFRGKSTLRPSRKDGDASEDKTPESKETVAPRPPKPSSRQERIEAYGRDSDEEFSFDEATKAEALARIEREKKLAESKAARSARKKRRINLEGDVDKRSHKERSKKDRGGKASADPEAKKLTLLDAVKLKKRKSRRSSGDDDDSSESPPSSAGKRRGEEESISSSESSGSSKRTAKSKSKSSLRNTGGERKRNTWRSEDAERLRAMRKAAKNYAAEAAKVSGVADTNIYPQGSKKTKVDFKMPLAQQSMQQKRDWLNQAIEMTKSEPGRVGEWASKISIPDAILQDPSQFVAAPDRYMINDERGNMDRIQQERHQELVRQELDRERKHKTGLYAPVTDMSEQIMSYAESCDINKQLTQLGKYYGFLAETDLINRTLTSMAETLTRDDRESTVCAGDIYYDLCYELVPLLGQQPSFQQWEFLNALFETCIAHIYGKDFRAKRGSLLEMFNRYSFYFAAILTCPRRFGKTSVVSFGTSIILYVSPGVKIVVYATTVEVAANLIVKIKIVVLNLPDSQGRIVRDDTRKLWLARIDEKPGYSIKQLKSAGRLNRVEARAATVHVR